MSRCTPVSHLQVISHLYCYYYSHLTGEQFHTCLSYQHVVLNSHLTPTHLTPLCHEVQNVAEKNEQKQEKIIKKRNHNLKICSLLLPILLISVPKKVKERNTYASKSAERLDVFADKKLAKFRVVECSLQQLQTYTQHDITMRSLYVYRPQ